jgi:hypothetical protein
VDSGPMTGISGTIEPLFADRRDLSCEVKETACLARFCSEGESAGSVPKKVRV